MKPWTALERRTVHEAIIAGKTYKETGHGQSEVRREDPFPCSRCIRFPLTGRVECVRDSQCPRFTFATRPATSERKVVTRIIAEQLGEAYEVLPVGPPFTQDDFCRAADAVLSRSASPAEGSPDEPTTCCKCTMTA